MRVLVSVVLFTWLLVLLFELFVCCLLFGLLWFVMLGLLSVVVDSRFGILNDWLVAERFRLV